MDDTALWALPATAFILATSLYIFANVDMKTEDNYFVGFPAIWNIFALYVYVLDPPKAATLAVTVALGLASFSSAKFLHPLRVREGRPITLAATVVWSVTSLIGNGINDTSNPLQYAGRSSYGLRPVRRTFGKAVSGETSIVVLPSKTSVPWANRLATWTSRSTSTQSLAISPK